MPAPRRVDRFFVSRDAIYCLPLGRAFLQPAHAEALWIAVNQGGDGSAERKVARKVGCQRRLAATALGIQYDDLLKIVAIGRNKHLPASVPLSLAYDP